MRREPTVSELVSFRWHRLDSPEWRAFTPSDTWEPRDKGDPDEAFVMIGQQGEAYGPLKEEPALFRIFADLDDTQEAFADFAQQYGRLTWSLVDPPWQMASTEYSGGYFDSWCRSRRQIARAVLLWDELRSGRPAHLLEILQDRFEIRRTRDTLAVHGKGPGWQSSPPWFVLPNRSTDREIAQALFHRELWHGLHSRDISLELAPTGKVYGAGFRLTYAVDSLEAAMWLQFILAIDGNRDYRTCAGCGNSWDSTGARKTRDYCSEKCRQRIQRRNREDNIAEASRLEGEGLTPQQTAERMSTSEEAVTAEQGGTDDGKATRR